MDDPKRATIKRNVKYFIVISNLAFIGYLLLTVLIKINDEKLHISANTTGEEIDAFESPFQ